MRAALFLAMTLASCSWRGKRPASAPVSAPAWTSAAPTASVPPPRSAAAKPSPTDAEVEAQQLAGFRREFADKVAAFHRFAAALHTGEKAWAAFLGGDPDELVVVAIARCDACRPPGDAVVKRLVGSRAVKRWLRARGPIAELRGDVGCSGQCCSVAPGPTDAPARGTHLVGACLFDDTVLEVSLVSAWPPPAAPPVEDLDAAARGVSAALDARDEAALRKFLDPSRTVVNIEENDGADAPDNVKVSALRGADAVAARLDGEGQCYSEFARLDGEGQCYTEFDCDRDGCCSVGVEDDPEDVPKLFGIPHLTELCFAASPRGPVLSQLRSFDSI